MKGLPSLDHVLLQLIVKRLLLPLLLLWIAAVSAAGYFFLQSLNYQQQQTVKSISQLVDRHLEQGTRILDAISRVAETKSSNDILPYMQSTWAAYKHFDTIYYLDESKKISLMIPSDTMYLGLDMSNSPYFEKTGDKDSIKISRPFISLRTGNPTVYLTRQLARGGYIAGELNLGELQAEIVNAKGAANGESIFILDQSGTLLAHPTSALVKQRTNLNDLEIFHRGISEDTSLVYNYDGVYYLGNATKVTRVGWVIVEQVPLSTLLGPYTITFGLTFFISLGIWTTLMWNLRKRLQKNIVSPLVHLSKITEALSIGNYGQVNVLASMNNVFAEINGLANDFLSMSIKLQARQAELRESEERYCLLNAELENKVVERTKQLEEINIMLEKEIAERICTEKALVASKNEAQAANSAKSRFLANMSHEIRTPMNGILGYLQLLETTELNAEQLDFTHNMKTSTNTLLTVINDILDISKIEAGKLIIENISFDLPMAVEAVIFSLSAQAKEKGLELRIFISPDIPQFVNGDPTRLKQVLINLIGNAIKFTTQGHVCIEVSLNHEHQTSAEIFFKVSDTGIGISPAALSNLFKPFTQADASLTRKYGGTGLGLAICKNLVERMGGKISVESQENIGTTFSFSLIFSTEKNSGQPILSDYSILRGKRILLVDQDSNSCEITKIYLQETGCMVSIVDNSINALNEAVGKEGSSIYNAIIISNQLTDMTCDILAETMKAIPAARNLPLILLKSSDTLGKEHNENWFSGTLAKPFIRNELYNTVAKVLTDNNHSVDLMTQGYSKTMNEKKFEILVADDNEISRSFFTKLLKMKGLHCDTVQDGTEAVNAFNSKTYDLIFMDCQMPVLDGYEATKTIRLIEGDTKHTPIVAITAHAMKGDEERCLATGMDEYLSKPIDINQVTIILAKYLQVKQN